MIALPLSSTQQSLQLISILSLVASTVIAGDGSVPGFQGKSIEFPAPYAYPMNKGAGYETVQKCAICHSFGYILNQGKQSRTFWEHETHKMVATYKAPITTEEEQMIVNYLSTFYGNGKE